MTVATVPMRASPWPAPLWRVLSATLSPIIFVVATVDFCEMIIFFSYAAAKNESFNFNLESSIWQASERKDSSD
jgi:hypothetical protein